METFQKSWQSLHIYVYVCFLIVSELFLDMFLFFKKTVPRFLSSEMGKELQLTEFSRFFLWLFNGFHGDFMVIPQMWPASKEEDYEEAAILKRRIKVLEETLGHLTAISHGKMPLY